LKGKNQASCAAYLEWRRRKCSFSSHDTAFCGNHCQHGDLELLKAPSSHSPVPDAGHKPSASRLRPWLPATGTVFRPFHHCSHEVVATEFNPIEKPRALSNSEVLPKRDLRLPQHCTIRTMPWSQLVQARGPEHDGIKFGCHSAARPGLSPLPLNTPDISCQPRVAATKWMMRRRVPRLDCSQEPRFNAT
jgi:hypothetical protein